MVVRFEDSPSKVSKTTADVGNTAANAWFRHRADLKNSTVKEVEKPAAVKNTVASGAVTELSADMSAAVCKSQTATTAPKSQISAVDLKPAAVIVDLRAKLAALKAKQVVAPANREQTTAHATDNANVSAVQCVSGAATSEQHENLISPDFGGRLMRQNAKEAALRLLARQQLSQAEVQNKLLKKEFPLAVAADIAAECAAEMLIDETAMATSIAANYAGSKGMSSAQIRTKLLQRKITATAIEAALASLDKEAEAELLRESASNRAAKLADLDFNTAERRLLAYLARRGWHGYEVREIAREALRAAGVVRHTQL